MNSITKILFSFLFVFKATSHASFKHDITKRLDTCIANILTKVSVDSMWNEFQDLRTQKISEFEYAVDAQVENLPRNVIFRDISFVLTDCVLPQYEWNFEEKKLLVSTERLVLNMKAELQTGKNESNKVHIKLKYFNFTLNLAASQNNRNVRKLSVSYDSITIERGFFEDDFFDLIQTQFLSSKQKTEMGMIITEAAPQIFIEFLNRNRVFDTIYKTYGDWRNDLDSTYPDFATDEKPFYYLIPRAPFSCFYFEKIVIKGLSNFHLIRIHQKPQIFTHTLLIKNVVGRMNLNYGISEEKPMRLNFHIDYLTVSFNKFPGLVNVNARFYNINGTEGPLTFRQSPIVMHGIESAIASSIMPTMTVEKIRDTEIVHNQIKVTKSSDWNAMKESYKKWIPFNDHNTS